MIVFIAYIATIFAANWAISTFGLVPVGFGLLAPAGVYFVGIGFTLRDLVQHWLGKRWTIVAILIGAGLSLVFGGQLALASGLAFLFSELADFAVYTPLHKHGWFKAVVLSNIAGDIVDSTLFLLLAFGSLDFIAGQLVGKWYMTLLAVGIICLYRNRCRLGMHWPVMSYRGLRAEYVSCGACGHEGWQ